MVGINPTLNVSDTYISKNEVTLLLRYDVFAVVVVVVVGQG